MSYLRLFIELQREDSGEGCGQARVELQDWPGRVDCKVRCGLMGLTPGQLYEMALVCEQSGRYKEYPLGQFVANARGQAGPIFRGGFELEPDQISVTEFKAIVIRPQMAQNEGGHGSGKRIVGYRFEPMLIPLKYEETEAESAEQEAEAKQEAEAELKEVAGPEGVAAPEGVAVPEGVAAPEAEVSEIKLMMELEAARAEQAAMEAEIEREILPEASVPEEPVILQESMEEIEPPMFAPAAIYVLRDLRQVDLMCGDAGRRAFQRYRHLILAQQDKANYLGIPCRFRPSQRIELAEEGYTLFYTPHGEEPGFGEFGYWMKRL